MKQMTVFLAAAALGLAGPALADTRSSDQDKATMEHKASPSNPTKQDEERTEAHSQPDTPHAGGTTPRNAGKSSPKHTSKEKAKAGASTGSSSPSPNGTDARSGIDLDAAFKKADIDGDNAVSKAEAAGNERLVSGFDRADRNHDGKLTRAEFDSVYRAKPKQAKAKQAAAKQSASRGGSRKE